MQIIFSSRPSWLRVESGNSTSIVLGPKARRPIARLLTSFHKGSTHYPCGWCAHGLGGADWESIRRTEQAQGLHRIPGEKGDFAMQLLMSDRMFYERHRVIDALRSRRESGDPLIVETEAVQGLLQEIDLLQVVAQAAELVAEFPATSAGESFVNLRHALRRWKE